MSDASPLDAAIGLHLDSYADDGSAVLRLDPTANAWGDAEASFLHGGALATCVDTAGWYATVRARPGAYVAIDLRADYLRIASRGTYRVTGRVLRSGRTLTVADVTIAAWDDPERVVAVGRVQFIRTGD